MSLAFALCAAACGKVNTFTDAGGDDDSIDGNNASTLTVTTYSRTGVQAIVSGVDIVASHADGSVGDMAQTDADGNATLDVHAGDTITAVYRRVDGGDLVSILGVKPGDHLVFGRQGAASTAVVGSMSVTWTDVGDSSYSVYEPCGSASGGAASTGTSFSVYEHCQADTLDLVFVGFDASGNVAHTAKLEDVTFVNGGTVGISEWQPPTAFTVSVTGLPPEVTQTFLSVSPLVDGLRSYTVSVEGVPTDGMFSQTRAWAPTGEPITAVGSFRRTGNFGAQAHFQPLPANSTQWTLDQPTTLPWVGETLASAAAREITWVQTDGAGYDAAFVISNWSHTNEDAGVSNSTWNFVAPPGVDRIAIPELPGTLAPYMPQDSDFLAATAVLIEVAEDDGYDVYRQRPEFESLGALFSGLPAPTALTLSIGYDN